jgi:hypothetical protein
MTQFGLGQRAFVTAVVIFVFRLIALPGTAAAQDVAAPSFGRPSHHGPKSVDPGPRGGAPGAGGPLSGLDNDEQVLFKAAKSRFQEIDSV